MKRPANKDSHIARPRSGRFAPPGAPPRSRRRGPALLVALGVSLLAGAAHADVPSDKAAAAEALFQEARTLTAKGNHAAACPKYKASHELDPGYGVLFNLAECFANVGKTASAWAAYMEAAGMAKTAGQKDRVEKAEKRAAELSPKLEKITVVVNDPPAGLVVRRDGVALDAATWGVALPADPGKHTFVAEAPGKQPHTAEVSTGGPGKTVTVTLPALEAAPVTAPAASAGPTATTGPVTAPAEDSGRATRRTIGLVVGGAGVAAVVVGAVMGGLANSKWNDAQDNFCRTENLCDDTGVALVGEAKTFATVSTALFIGGGVLAAGGATLFLVSLGGGKKEATGLTLVPSAGPQSGGLLVKGRF